jgi:hypothetical protein
LIAARHAGASCSRFGNCAMELPASRRGRAQPCSRHQHVEPTAFRHGGLDGGAGKLRLADIADMHAAAAAALTQHRKRLFGAGGVAVDQRDEGTFAR